MKKLLYIAHGSNDFMDDMLFCGLPYFLDQYEIYYAISDCEFGSPRSIEQRAEFITYEWKETWIDTAKKLLPAKDKDIIYDICIIGQAWKENQIRFYDFAHCMNHDTKVAYVYAVDEMNAAVPVFVPFSRAFITNYANDWDSDINDYSKEGVYLPLSCPYELIYAPRIEFPTKCVNLQLGLTNEVRGYLFNEVFTACGDLGILDQSNIGIYQGDNMWGNTPRTPMSEFWPLIQDSKIIFHEMGAGTDAFRFWEGIATGNFVVCSPNNFYQCNNMPLPPNVFFWKQLSDIKPLIQNLLEIGDDERKDIKDRAKQFVLQHHAPHCRINRILYYLGEK